MGSDCQGDSSSTEWSNYNSSRSRESSPSPRHRHSRRSNRSRTRSRRTDEHKRIRSPTFEQSKRSSRHRRGRSQQHHSGHSRDHSSASRGHYSHRSHGGSHRSSDMPRAHSRSHAASNLHSERLVQWAPSDSTTTGRWSHDGYLQTYASYPATKTVPSLTPEEGLRLATQGSHCAGCARAPLADIIPDCTADHQAAAPAAMAPPVLPPCPIAACQDDECAATTKRWCDVDITYIPPRFRTAADLEQLHRLPPRQHAMFYGLHRQYAGHDLMVAITPTDLDIGLHWLELSMPDDVIAIDLEWKADTDKDQDNRVALVQLASPSVVLLIKTTGLDFMPGPLEAFLRKKGRTFVGLGWGSADEKKMRKSFGFGRDDFSRFIDLQDVFGELGYPSNQVNIPGIAANCFGLVVLSMRSWEIMMGWDTPVLSVVYAARDAVLTGYAYRQLRAWHDATVNPAKPTTMCEACGRAFGVPTEWRMGPTPIRCWEDHCRRTFLTVQALADHATSTKHAASHVQCFSCNRLCSVE